ncbi:hypothetical protein M2298_000183 [Brevibacillus sp. 1238]|jgi:hypothetical protein|nr:hypothetical protein [Brevibacillus sp. 1238]
MSAIGVPGIIILILFIAAIVALIVKLNRPK